MNKILVSEIFGPTLQGEGALAGLPTVFVRTGGCDFRCSWCDSMHAVDPKRRGEWAEETEGQIMLEVRRLTKGVPCMVTISGGNPALQPLDGLIDLGHEHGYTFAMETQGSIAKPWFHKLDHLTLSPKPPSSGMAFRASRLRDCIDAAHVDRFADEPRCSLKVVVMTEDDYHFARVIYDEFASPLSIPFFITPGNHTPPAGALYNKSDREFDAEGVLARTRWLVERVAEDRWFDVTIIPQLHTLIWGNRQGV